MLSDEPSSGLDEEGFRRFWLFCEDLRSQSKASILLATHRSEEAERCDRLVVLHQGKLIANDTPENLRARVAGDRVMLKLDDHPGPDVQGTWFGSLQTAFPGLEFQKVANEIRVVADVGHSLVPRLIEALPKQAVQSVYVRKPSLADAYLQITGASL